jgi:hypothetical protein
MTPESVADHDDRRIAGPVDISAQEASGLRANAKHGEIVW